MLNVSPQLRLDANEFFNHPIFEYDGTEPEITNGLKSNVDQLNGDKELTGSEIFKESVISNSVTDNKSEHDHQINLTDDPSTRVMIFADIKKVYNLKILEINLIKSVVTVLFELIDQDWPKEFFSNYICLCIIIVKKAISKAEVALKTFEKGVNTFKLNGFNQYLEYPNEYILTKEEIQLVNEN